MRKSTISFYGFFELIARGLDGVGDERGDVRWLTLTDKTMADAQVLNVAVKEASIIAGDKAKVTVSVRFDQPDDKVYIGLEADVNIHTFEKEGVLTIPAEAFYSDDAGDYCYMISDGKIKKEYITVGSSSDEYIEVAAGLTNGDVVITDAITDDQIGKSAQSK